jgi:hypothetical protein
VALPFVSVYFFLNKSNISYGADILAQNLVADRILDFGRIWICHKK